MNAYENLKKSKKFFTKLELAVLYYGENPVDEQEVRDAEQAAAELAALTAALTEARGILKGIKSVDYYAPAEIEHYSDRAAAWLAKYRETR